MNESQKEAFRKYCFIIALLIESSPCSVILSFYSVFGKLYPEVSYIHSRLRELLGPI